MRSEIVSSVIMSRDIITSVIIEVTYMLLGGGRSLFWARLAKYPLPLLTYF